MFHVIFEASAYSDIEQAINYYQGVSNIQAARFKRKFEKAVKFLLQNPYLFQRRIKNSRFVNIDGFPYVIVYEIEDKLVIIYAVFNTSQDPEKLGKK